MTSPRPEVTDPARSGYSLANLAELLFACLDAIAAKSVVEVGAYRGDLTRALLKWAAGSGARVTAVELQPPPELELLNEQHAELRLLRESSEDALPDLPFPDALIVDGDHNYYTVSRELQLVDERSAGAEMPLLVFHDVGWPHGRRDAYHSPDRVPEGHRQPLVANAALAPGEAGVADAGLTYEWVAEREGGPRNGVLTAIEDFAERRDAIRVAVVPAFFGVGVVWHRDSPWAAGVAEILRPWDRNPLLQRLEANRVDQLIERLREEAEYGRIIHRERERRAGQEQVLRTMLGSRAFAWGEWLSRLRQGGRPAFSREQVKRALGE